MNLIVCLIAAVVFVVFVLALCKASKKGDDGKL